ncbi:MAG: twin-arginine translocation pathway signal protein [Rhizobiaceae bacterium]
MTSRRNFLSLVGGGVVLAATAGAWAATRDPSGARRPWEIAGQGMDARRRALSYAVLAPNPHNRQPWLADLSVSDEIALYCDPDRRLPETDPFDRQITIGLGCFLELLEMAAAQDGLRAAVTLFPDGEPQPRLDERPVARIRFSADGPVEGDPLFAHVLDRRSNKEPYDVGRPVDDAGLAAVAGAARTVGTAWTADPERVAALRDQAWQAMHLEISTTRTAKESIDLIRIGKAEIEANPDGIDLSGAFIEMLALTGLLDKQDMLDPSSAAFSQQLPILKAPFNTAMAFLWTTTRGNGRAEQIAAGRDHLRINLAATAAGLAIQPFSQALQEFSEMQPHREAMRAALGVQADETLQMFCRLGYGPEVAAAPRWPSETRIHGT